MRENWDSYLCRVDGKPALILVDLALAEAAPFPDLPIVGYVSVGLKAPDGNGFPDEKEALRLAALEDALAWNLTGPLTDLLTGDAAAVYAGRSLSDGRLDCFFYLNEEDNWCSRVSDAVRDFKDYEIEAGTDNDVAWDTYRTFLYPGEYDLLSMQNRRSCRALLEAGDNPEVSRVIEHYAEFADEASAGSFSAEVRKQGFSPETAVGEADTSTESVQLREQNSAHLEGASSVALLFLVRFSRPDSPLAMDTVTCDLWDAAKAHGGVYRGWSAPVVA